MGISVEHYMVAFGDDIDVNTQSTPDGPASETQIKYLNDLGVPNSEASIMTKAEATTKIDERREELAEVKKEQTCACTVLPTTLPLQAHAVLTSATVIPTYAVLFCLVSYLVRCYPCTRSSRRPMMARNGSRLTSATMQSSIILIYQTLSRLART